MLDLPNVIKAVGTELALLGTGARPFALEQPEPAVSLRHSVRPDHLVCLICGRKHKLLKGHLGAAHKLTPDEYRDTFGLKSDYPMVAPNYVRQRRELAVKRGFGGSTTGTRRQHRKSPDVTVATDTQ